MDWELLPTEVWETIFNYVDLTQLSKLQRVCQRWCAIIKKIFPGWKELCEKHVPVFWFRSAIMKSKRLVRGTKSYEAAINLPPKFWSDLYESWRQWQLSVNFPQSVKIINNRLQLSTLEEITCLVTDEDVVAFGTTEGNVYLSHFLDWKKPFFVAQHEHAITDIKFWRRAQKELCDVFRPYDEQDYVVISLCTNNYLKYWNYAKRIQLDFDARRQPRLINLWHLRLNVAEVYTHQNLGQFVTIKKDGTIISVWENQIAQFAYVDDSIRYQCAGVIPLSRNEKVVAINIFNDKAQVLSFDGKEIAISTVRNVQTELLRCYERRPLYFPRELLSSDRKEFHFLFQNFVICLTDHRVAFFIDNEPWFVHNLFDTLGGHVRSVCPNVGKSTLLFGLDSGAVYFFKIDVDEYLPNWSSPYHKVIFDTEPIIAVDIFKISNKSYIVAATKKKIYVDKKAIEC